jgi:hypothetical protein
MSRRAPPDWERVKHEFMFCPDPLDAIAARNGIGRAALTRHAQAANWQRKVKTVQRPRRTKAELAEAAAESTRQALSKSLAVRLYLAIDRKVQEIEMRMQQAEDEGRSAADVERDARTLSALARVYAKLVELDGASKPAADKRETEAKPSPARSSEDADQLRRDLARRLERLDRNGDA